jgi:cytochrome c oxidase accessory protein FixG
MTTSRRIQPWRWLVKGAQAVAVLGLPFVTIGGDSALRFDIPSLTLHVFGTPIGMDEFFIVLVAVLFLTFLIITLTILFGRIWCGWLCPQTVVVDLTLFVDRSAGRGAARRGGAFLAVMALSPLLAAGIIWYFVSPYEFFRRIGDGSLGPVIGWSWAILTAVTFLNFGFLRHTFCSTVCPYAKLQGSLFDERTLVIAADRERMDECMHCDACVRTCPVTIDVRQGLNAACINCAECIDACAGRMARRDKASLIGYRFGTGLQVTPAVRRPVVLAGTATAVFLGLLIALALARLPFELDVLADASQPPRRHADRSLVNTYILSMTNRTASAIELSVTASAAGHRLRAAPDRIVLERNTHRRIMMTVLWDDGEGVLSGPELLTISAESRQFPGIRLDRQTTIMPPWQGAKP